MFRRSILIIFKLYLKSNLYVISYKPAQFVILTFELPEAKIVSAEVEVLEILVILVTIIKLVRVVVVVEDKVLVVLEERHDA